MLDARQLTCLRGTRRLFSGIDFVVGPGCWAHVRGANGAGKTSLLRLLTGLTPPDAGEVRWNGERVGGERFRGELMYLGHAAAVKEDLSAVENLICSAAVEGMALSRGIAEAALQHWGLTGSEDLPVRYLSSGQKRRVLLARMVCRPARLWVLDEPFTALDVHAGKVLSKLLAGHLAGGGVAVITSHQAVPLAAPPLVVDL